MRKIHFFAICTGLFLFSCADDIVENNPANTNLKEKQENVVVTRVLTDAEQSFKDKIMRLAGNEFRNELNTMTDKELENLAVSFLLPESNRILLENGYTEKNVSEIHFKMII